MKRNISKIIIIMTLSLVTAFLLAGCGKESKSDDPNLGVYTATEASMGGISISVDEAFEDGFTIELKDKGKCVLTIDGTSAKGKWTLDDGDFTVEGGGVDCEGTLSNGVIKLEDVMGAGIDMTLVNEDFEGASDESGDAPDGNEPENPIGKLKYAANKSIKNAFGESTSSVTDNTGSIDENSSDDSSSDDASTDEGSNEDVSGGDAAAAGESFDNVSPSGSSYTWGNITVNVPDGFDTSNGNAADHEDKDSLSLTQGMKYINVSVSSPEWADSGIKMTKDMNDADDLSFSVNGNVWTGIIYEYSGTPCWQVYSTVNGTTYLVGCYGFDYSSQEALTVFSSLN